jgi:hypothetical protein
LGRLDGALRASKPKRDVSHVCSRPILKLTQPTRLPLQKF